MRHAHVCPHCDQRSTRWWNLKVHIKRRHDRFLLDSSLDRYMGRNLLSPNNPYHNIGSATIDSVGNTFEPTYLRQTPLGISQYSPTIDEQRHESGLSQGTVGRIIEVKGLLNKYPQQHIPDGIIRMAIFNSINGDNTLLDQMVVQLYRLDSYNTWPV